MHVILLQENLNHALHYVQRTVPTKPNLTILSAVLLTTTETGLELAGTDLYLGVKTIVPAEDIKPGSVAVPGKTLVELVSQLSPGKLELDLQGSTLTIKNKEGVTKLQCQPADEFPVFPVADEGTVTVPVTMLNTVMETIVFAVSADVSRPVLTTLLWAFADQQIDVVATDGFRLAFDRFSGIEAAELASKQARWLVPARALQEVARVVSSEKADQLSCQYSLAQKQLVFTVNSTSIFVRLLDGEYPPYEKIIPSVFTIEAWLEPEELLKHLKRAQIFARDAANIIHLTWSENQLVIEATSPSAGHHQSTLAVESVKAGDNKIAFNLKYLMDVLTAAKQRRLWFGMSESLKPAMFRLEGETSYGYVVMPFRVTE